MHTVNIRLKQTGFDNFSGRQCCHLSRKVVLSPQSLWPLLASKIVNYFFDHNHTCGFQHYMFNMESRNLLNLSVQNALNCISERFNLKNFPGGACARNSLVKCAVRSPYGRYHAHTTYYVSRPPPSQSPPSASASLHQCSLLRVFKAFQSYTERREVRTRMWCRWGLNSGPCTCTERPRTN